VNGPVHHDGLDPDQAVVLDRRAVDRRVVGDRAEVADQRRLLEADVDHDENPAGWSRVHSAPNDTPSGSRSGHTEERSPISIRP
jgi:hypothetical protein